MLLLIRLGSALVLCWAHPVWAQDLAPDALVRRLVPSVTTALRADPMAGADQVTKAQDLMG